MARVKLYHGDGDAKSQAIQEKLTAQFGGKLPEVFQAMGASGDFLEAMLKLAGCAGKNLDPKCRELIAIAVSAVNGCEYCLSAHRASARKAGASDEEISGALEIAAQMSAFNNFNKALGLTVDIK